MCIRDRGLHVEHLFTYALRARVCVCVWLYYLFCLYVDMITGQDTREGAVSYTHLPQSIEVWSLRRRALQMRGELKF